jgi:hypothetical protein
MAQQTAVEWLIEQLIKMDKELDGRRKNEDATVLKLNPIKLFEQAKAMEKDQIVHAWENGALPDLLKEFKNSRIYYNETYNK